MKHLYAAYFFLKKQPYPFFAQFGFFYIPNKFLETSGIFYYKECLYTQSFLGEPNGMHCQFAMTFQKLGLLQSSGEAFALDSFYTILVWLGELVAS